MSLYTSAALVAALAAFSAASPVQLKNLDLIRRQSVPASVPAAVASSVSAALAPGPVVASTTVPALSSAAPVLSSGTIISAAPTETSDPEGSGDTTDWCANVDLGKVEDAASIWNDRGVGNFLDDYLEANGESNWLNNMASGALPGSGDPGSAGCGNRDQSCLPSVSNCAALAAAGHGAEYWVFNAVQKLQDAFERAHENLQDSVIDSSLTVSTIASDFKITFQSNQEILRYIAAAFTMASGLIGYGSGAFVNGFKTTASMFGGVFASTANTPPVNIDPSKAMDSTLKDIFHAQLSILDSTQKLAVGGSGDYATLPDQSGDYTTSVAKFMADGKFLLQGDMVNDYFSAGYDSLNKKLVDIAMAQYGYIVLADHNYEDAGSCGEQHGAFWLDILGGRCMRLTYKDGDNTYYPASEDVINKIQDTYHINVYDYYKSTCDCAMNGSGEPDLNSLPEDGSAPQCFYNLPCQDAEICLESDDVTWNICWPIDINEVASFGS